MLEYIELMCIEAHLEAHVYVLYILTHLGLEEYNNYYPPTLGTKPNLLKMKAQARAALTPFVAAIERGHWKASEYPSPNSSRNA